MDWSRRSQTLTLRQMEKRPSISCKSHMNRWVLCHNSHAEAHLTFTLLNVTSSEGSPQSPENIKSRVVTPLEHCAFPLGTHHNLSNVCKALLNVCPHLQASDVLKVTSDVLKVGVTWAWLIDHLGLAHRSIWHTEALSKYLLNEHLKTKSQPMVSIQHTQVTKA